MVVVRLLRSAHASMRAYVLPHTLLGAVHDRLLHLADVARRAENGVAWLSVPHQGWGYSHSAIVRAG